MNRLYSYAWCIQSNYRSAKKEHFINSSNKVNLYNIKS